MSRPENPGQMVADLHLRLARTEIERDEWMNQVVGIRQQQREALVRAISAESHLDEVRFRVDSTCSHYEHLMDDEVPGGQHHDAASYQSGSADAARSIRDALTGDEPPRSSAVLVGTGDDLDVAAGRCCPSCRTDLAQHNRDVWNAGYSIGQRHGGAS